MRSKLCKLSKSEPAVKALTAFLTLCLVLEMLPAQSIAFAIDEASEDPAIVEEYAPEPEQGALPEEDVTQESEAVAEELQQEAATAEEPNPIEEEALTEEPAAAPETASEESVASEEPAQEASAPEESFEPEAAAEETKPEFELSTEPLHLSKRASGRTIVVIDAPAGSLPAGVALQVEDVTSQDILDAVNGITSDEVASVQAIDITFWYRGIEVQPALPVQVSFVNTTIDTAASQVFHMDDAGAITEVSDVAVAETDEVVFTADSFSVYVVVETGETGDNARLTLNFINGEDTVASMQVKKADIGDQFNTVLYDPGVGEMSANQVFRGWTTNQNYTVDDINSGLTIDDVRNEVKAELESDVADGTSANYYALVYTVYDVTYKANDNVVLGIEPIYVVKSGDPANYTINMSYAPEASDQDFKGWIIQETENATLPDDSPVTSDPYANGTAIKLKGSITLTAKAPMGAWLVFKENGSNVSYTSPQFLETGQTTEEPSDPTRVGYEFGGWYTDEACADGNKFTFNTTLEKTTTVYAKWTPQSTASYTVIIWKQNVNDAKDAVDSAKTYDFAESVTLTGPTNSVINTVTASDTGDSRYASINGTAKRYTGFHLNTFDENVTIAPEGTSVLNVYYDRNVVTLTFQYRSGNSWATLETMTGLYGQTLAQNGYTWPTNRWWYDSYSSSYGTYSGSGTRTTFLDAFILPNGTSSQTFYGFNGNGSNTIRFYKQNSDGTYPSTATNEVSSGNGTFYISDKYNGYKAVSYSTNGTTWTNLGEKDDDGYYASVSNYTNLYIRYAPMQYNISYMDGVYVDGNGVAVEGYSPRGQLNVVKNINFGSDISSYGTSYTPTFNNFVFSGWYVDDACTTPYSWTTMPEGVTVYAKWVQTQYRVFLHPNAPTSDTTFSMGEQNTSFRVSAGETINAVNGVREDYELVGWYSDEACTHNFNFDAFVLNDTTVTGTYDKTRSTELDQYGNPTEATNKDVDRPWITRCLDLYAKWRSKLIGAEGITVVYDAGDGTNAPTDSRLYKDSALAVAGAASTAPTKKAFSHWVVQKWDGSEFVDTDETVLPGDTFTVLKANTQVVANADNTPESPSYTYTVQLRAEYVDAEHPTTTHITWHANNGTDDMVSDDPVDYNASVAIRPADTFTWDDHTFLGWAKSTADASAPTEVNFLWYKDGKFYSDAACTKVANNIAADEKQPYEDLYAIWAEDVTAVIEGTEGTTTYNGKEQSNTGYTVTYYVGGAKVNSLPEGVTFTQDPTTPAAKGTNVGEYSQAVTGTLTSTVAKYVVPKDAVTGGTIKLTIEKAVVTLTSESGEKPFDGTPLIKPTITVDGNGAAVFKSEVTDVKATGTITEVGEVKNTITYTEGAVFNADNYTITKDEGTLLIMAVSDKVTVTITEHSGEFTFDGKEHEVKGYDANISNPLYKETDFTFSGNDTVKGTEAGSYPMELKPSDFANTSKNFTNVEFMIVDGQLVITQKPIDDPDKPDNPAQSIAVKGPEDTVYNGLEQDQRDTLTITDEGTGATLREGKDYKLIYSDDITNVGTVDVRVEGIGNYTGAFNLSYKITPAQLTIVTDSDKKAYDGTPLTNGHYTIDGLVNEETLGVKTTGSQTLVGSSLNTVELTWADTTQTVNEPIPAKRILLPFAADEPTALSTNYALVVDLGTLTVTDEGLPTDLVVKKTHEAREYRLGEPVEFTLTATNIYDEARDITFVELPGVDVEKATFEKVPAGATVTTTATYIVTEADILAGTFKNEVTVKIGDAEHGPAEDEVDVEKKNSHLTVTKTVTTAEPAGGFAKGDRIEYQIIVKNDGNVTISNVKVTDKLTGDEWTIDALAPDEEKTFTTSYTVTEADAKAGKVVNTATATGTDPDGGDPTVTPGTTESKIKQPDAKPSGKPAKGKKLPQTSDSAASALMIESMVTAGLSFIALGLHGFRKKERDDEE